MALDSKTLIPCVVAALVVVAIAASAVYVFTNDNDTGESKDSLIIEGNQTITLAQLNNLKDVAKTDSKVKLTYKTSDYEVVFDSKAIQNIENVAKLEVSDVKATDLGESNKVILSESKVIDIAYGPNSNFGDGSVTISIPYELKNGQSSDDVVVSYIANDNSLQQVQCKYEDGKATFTTNHFSKYAISVAVTLDSAGLKVLGNINADNYIDSKDVEYLTTLCNAKAPLYLYPLADADNNGVLDTKDVTAVNNVVKALADSSGATKATIWHINYFDLDGNGTMDEYLVSTTIPCVSAITTGSANTFSLLSCLGIVDEIKGASYSSSNDKFLYENTFLNTSKVEKLGTSSSSIPFEDGKIGASNIISEKKVTVVISDWNRTYLTNENNFETANVDVVRVAAASFDKEVYTHSIMLLGTVFNKIDNATALLGSYDNTYETINKNVSSLSKDKIKSAVASSMTGYLSSADSDYTAFCLAAGATFGLEGFDFGGSSSIVVKDNLGVFDNRKYKFDNIVHIRTALTYGSTTKEVAEYWSTYANAMSDWENAYEGQVLISGSVPVPVRVAYIAYALYHNECSELNLGWADDIHAEFASYYQVDIADAPNKTLCLTSYNYSITISDEVTVTDEKGNVVESGAKLPYGTKLHLAAKADKAGYTLKADGTTLADNGDFILDADVNARYVNLENIQKMTDAAIAFSGNLDSAYGTATAAKDNEGLATITYINYKAEKATKTIHFTYYDSAEAAQAAYTALKAKVTVKGYAGTLTEADFAEGAFDGLTAQFSNNLSAGKYAYSTLYLTAIKGNMVIDLISNDYTSCYKLYTTEEGKAFMEKTEAERLEFFTAEAKKFADAIAKALTPAEELDKQVAIDAASKFASSYTAGTFGTYTATDNTATAVVKTDRTITFTVEANAKAAFDTLVATIDTQVTGYTCLTVTEYEGLDNVYVFMKSRTMGSSEVSMCYVVATKDSILIDGTTSYQYRNTGFATADDVNALLAALVKAVTA